MGSVEAPAVSRSSVPLFVKVPPDCVKVEPPRNRIVPVASNPVSIAALPNGTKVYTTNLGSNTVTSFNTVDMSATNVGTFSSPVWAVPRSDSQKVYVLTAGDGNLVTIDTVTDTVSSSLAVGAGANYIAYDSKNNRLFVTNPTTAMVYVFSTTGGAGDTPSGPSTEPTAVPVAAPPAVVSGPPTPAPGSAPAAETVDTAKITEETEKLRVQLDQEKAARKKIETDHASVSDEFKRYKDATEARATEIPVKQGKVRVGLFRG